MTMMSVPNGGEISLEAPPETNQFLRMDAGGGKVRATAAVAEADKTSLANTGKASVTV